MLGGDTSKCLHNTLNVSHCDAHVLSLKISQCVFPDSRAGKESVTAAVLHVTFTSSLIPTRFPPHGPVFVSEPSER